MEIIADSMLFKIRNHAKTKESSEFVVIPNQEHGIFILNDGGMDGMDADGMLHTFFNSNPDRAVGFL